jgi:hypothetical protein
VAEAQPLHVYGQVRFAYVRTLPRARWLCCRIFSCVSQFLERTLFSTLLHCTASQHVYYPRPLIVAVVPPDNTNR